MARGFEIGNLTVGIIITILTALLLVFAYMFRCHRQAHRPRSLTEELGHICCETLPALQVPSEGTPNYPVAPVAVKLRKLKGEAHE